MAFKRISAYEAKEQLAQPEAILVDIRDEESFRQGHVNNAIHLTQDTLPFFLNQTDKNAPILVMCYHGNSSQMVADFLSGEGFSNVYSIDGGYEGW